MTESKARFSPSNPGPAAISLAKFVTESKGHEVTAAQAQAFLSFHGEWQRNRGPEREQLAAERAAAKAAKLAETKAKQIEAAKKLLAEAGQLPAEKAVAKRAS